jgi:hypothetical protein
VSEKYILYPAVHDWLQWADFPQELGKPSYPESALRLLAEMRSDIRHYREALESIAAHSPSERDREIALRALGRRTE